MSARAMDIKESISLQLNEEIKFIQGYEGLYSITSFGRVWSHKRQRRFGCAYRMCGGIFLGPIQNKKGYLCVFLGKGKNYRIHRLVATHFIPNPQNLLEVKHKDTNKLNNHVNNLEWCTNQENSNHASINNLRTHKKTSKYYGVSFSQSSWGENKWIIRTTVNKKQKHIGQFKDEIEAAKAYNDYVIENNLNKPLNYFGEYIYECKSN